MIWFMNAISVLMEKINVKIEAKAKLNILKDWKDIECKIASITLKITDFYWSTDKNEFGFRKCPHTQVIKSI